MLSKLELHDSYYKIPITGQDHHEIAFTCWYSTFEMVVLLFGLKNTPSHFKHSVNLLLADLLDACVLVYMDNILIFSKTKDEHHQHSH